MLRRGFSILDQNFRRRCGEIDIICRKDETLHFIEVKTRTEASISKFGPPQDAVTKAKQRKLIQTALTFFSESDFERNINWQMDVISIVYRERDRKARIYFIENAFGEG